MLLLRAVDAGRRSGRRVCVTGRAEHSVSGLVIYKDAPVSTSEPYTLAADGRAFYLCDGFCPEAIEADDAVGHRICGEAPSMQPDLDPAVAQALAERVLNLLPEGYTGSLAGRKPEWSNARLSVVRPDLTEAQIYLHAMRPGGVIISGISPRENENKKVISDMLYELNESGKLEVRTRASASQLPDTGWRRARST